MPGHALKARPLTHEGKQVGYILECPNCRADIDVPIGEFLDMGYRWQVPPQNSGIAPNGWHFAWGTQDNPRRLHLRQSMAVPHSEHGPGVDDQIVCTRRQWGPVNAQRHADIVTTGCGRAYRVVEGEMIEVQ